MADAAVLKDLAPTGTLRVAINLGNSVLVQKDDAGGAPGGIKGITPDLAHELGQRLGVPVELVPFEAAGKAFEALKANHVDIVFLANEPVRAAEIDFTAPYVIIYGNYMVPTESALKTLADVDKPRIRIAVGHNSAYDLFLTRTLKNATIVRAEKGGGRGVPPRLHRGDEGQRLRRRCARAQRPDRYRRPARHSTRKSDHERTVPVPA
ncbi:MAG: transporter substrate-binding domain-containing protein [Pseudolabrys sp.]